MQSDWEDDSDIDEGLLSDDDSCADREDDKEQPAESYEVGEEAKAELELLRTLMVQESLVYGSTAAIKKVLTLDLWKLTPYQDCLVFFPIDC